MSGTNSSEVFAAALRDAEDRLRATGLSGRRAYAALCRHFAHRLHIPDTMWLDGPDAPLEARLDRIPLTAELDLFGLAYERFFPEIFKAERGQFFTPRPLVELMVDLAEVVSDPTSKLILADELEAITEPGAGARIIAGMLLAAEAHPDTSMVLVTHLAPAIIEATGRDDLRIDGIEARGLDEDLELIVDRTPRRNHLARSTPELIVRRLVERSEGPAKAVFASILDAF